MTEADVAARVERILPSLEPGTLVTRPVRFSGRYLFLNLEAPEGELRAEILDHEGRLIPGFSASECVPVRGDSTRARVNWTGAGDLRAVAGQPVRFRFRLTRGRLYAFWVSASESGASGGYVAAGGPGLTGMSDV